jgi:hypothetical protein
VSSVVLDDHLLRDLLTDEAGPGLRRSLRRRTPATTNLYYVRLCRSAVSARGGQLTGTWPSERRRALSRVLGVLPDDVTVVPLRELGMRLAELAQDHGLSVLGAEAVAAAEHLGATLCVWEGDDGPRIRTCATAVGVDYRVLSRA